MRFRPNAALTVSVAATFVAGCGSDSASKSTASKASAAATGAKALTDVPPRASKANVAGGTGPIGEFVNKAAADAVSYWGQVFAKSNVSYREPKLNVLDTAGDNGCGASFDPTAKAFFLCASSGGTTISLGAPLFDKVRTDKGDGAVVFLAGFAAALDANDQLSGNPIAEKGEVSDAFVATTACFTGAWIRNLADRQILEVGDDAEVLDIAGTFVGADATVGKQAVANGFENGVAACQGGDTTTAQPQTPTDAAPAPTP